MIIRRAWAERPIEEANLFNPAFCAIVLAAAAKDFQNKAKFPLPFPLVFLVLPIVLHEPTRTSLPHSTLTTLIPWLQDNRTALVGFSGRVKGVRPVTREALVFGIAHSVLQIIGEGMLPAKHFSVSKAEQLALLTDDARSCIDRASFLGRWFAASGTSATIFAAWGVAP